jgi:hypothetical protein
MTKNALTLGLAIALAVSATAARAVFTPEPLGGDAGDGDETTISVRTGHDANATVVRVPDLAVGESKTLRSESGKDVTVTRVEDGWTVSINGHEVHVKTPGGALPGTAHGEDVKTIVTGDGVKKVFVTRHGYGFSTATATSEGPGLSASELLDKHSLDALAGADARTKETVAKALEELVRKGVVIAPAMETLPGSDDGERVEVRVMRKHEK